MGNRHLTAEVLRALGLGTLVTVGVAVLSLRWEGPIYLPPAGGLAGLLATLLWAGWRARRPRVAPAIVVALVVAAAAVPVGLSRFPAGITSLLPWSFPWPAAATH